MCMNNVLGYVCDLVNCILHDVLEYLGIVVFTVGSNYLYNWKYEFNTRSAAISLTTTSTVFSPMDMV